MQIRVEGHGVPGVFPEIFVTNSVLSHPADQRSMPMLLQPECLESKALSDHLQCNYRVLFPKSQQLLEHIKKPTYYRLHTTVNVLNFLASFLYLTAAMGLLANAIVATTDSDLKNNTPTVVRARTFTDILGYFAAPFIIPLWLNLENRF